MSTTLGADRACGRGLGRPSDRQPVLLGQRPQLSEGVLAAPTCRWNQDACPPALGAGRRAGFLRALPATGARATQRPGTLIARGGPPIWIGRTGVRRGFADRRWTRRIAEILSLRKGGLGFFLVVFYFSFLLFF